MDSAKGYLGLSSFIWDNHLGDYFVYSFKPWKSSNTCSFSRRQVVDYQDCKYQPQGRDLGLHKLDLYEDDHFQKSALNLRKVDNGIGLASERLLKCPALYLRQLSPIEEGSMMRTEKNGSNFTPEMFYIYNSHTIGTRATEKTEKEYSELWNASYERAKQKKGKNVFYLQLAT